MIIALKTGYNSSLGMGHIQRMCSLAWYLIEKKRIDTYIVSEAVPDSFPDELIPCLKHVIDFSPDIIIRDMRESEENEIFLLKKIAKIISIDDNGPGAEQADYIIDILPNLTPHNTALRYNNFLYGYNFIKSLEILGNRTIRKSIDFSIYPGNSATDEYQNYLISLLPKKTNFAMMNGKKSYIQISGERLPVENTNTERLLSSKILISHFGITLFEGLISKCRLIAINPTAYHSKLSDIVKEKINLINLGEFQNLNTEDAANTIERVLTMPELDKEVNAESIYHMTLNGLEEFYKLLIKI